jgi:hypothetical protein
VWPLYFLEGVNQGWLQKETKTNSRPRKTPCLPALEDFGSPHLIWSTSRWLVSIPGNGLSRFRHSSHCVSISTVQQTQKTSILLKRPHALVSQNPVSQALVLHGRNPTNTMSAGFSFSRTTNKSSTNTKQRTFKLTKNRSFSPSFQIHSHPSIPQPAHPALSVVARS